jgi:hypothetical protein
MIGAENSFPVSVFETVNLIRSGQLSTLASAIETIVAMNASNTDTCFMGLWVLPNGANEPRASAT